VPNAAPDRAPFIDIGCDLPYDNRSSIAAACWFLGDGRTIVVLIPEWQTKLTEAGDGTASQSLDLEATFNGMARFAGVVVDLGT
jgi:hypothetical protein